MVFEGLEAVAAQMGYKSGYAKGYSKGFKVRPLPSSLLSLGLPDLSTWRAVCESGRLWVLTLPFCGADFGRVQDRL